jgi:hypothetical protein
MQRRRSVSHTFEENIAAEKAKLEAQMEKLKPGHQMDALRKKIRQLDTASHISDWLSDCSLLKAFLRLLSRNRCARNESYSKLPGLSPSEVSGPSAYPSHKLGPLLIAASDRIQQ